MFATIEQLDQAVDAAFEPHKLRLVAISEAMGDDESDVIRQGSHMTEMWMTLREWKQGGGITEAAHRANGGSHDTHNIVAAFCSFYNGQSVEEKVALAPLVDELRAHFPDDPDPVSDHWLNYHISGIPRKLKGVELPNEVESFKHTGAAG